MTDLDERLRDFGSDVHPEAPPFARLADRARRRRRNHAVAVGAAVVIAAAGIALVTAPRSHVADPPPASTDVPMSRDGQLTDVVSLLDGRLIVLYSACPTGVELCVPHAYDWADFPGVEGGPRWFARRDDGVPVQSGTQFAVSAHGDVALVADTPLDRSDASSAPDGLVGSTVSYDDRGMNRFLVGTGEPWTPSQIPDPERAIALVEPDGFLVVAGELHRLAVTPLFGHYADEFSFAAAEDGVLTGEYDEQDGVSLDLGQTWLPVPKVDGVEYSSAITRPGGRLTRLWYGDGSGATGDSVRLTYIQTSDDQGRAWSAQKVSGEPVRTAVAMSEGTYTATSPDGSFLRSDDGATFARATGPIGRITQMGGHTGEAWAVTDAGQLWVSTDGRGVRWLQIPLPE
jgi:hypothetical protein